MLLAHKIHISSSDITLNCKYYYIQHFGSHNFFYTIISQFFFREIQTFILHLPKSFVVTLFKKKIFH